MNAVGSKSSTCAAIVLRKGEASKRFSARTGERARWRPSQSASMPIPDGVIGPIPVTTTRRGAAPFSDASMLVVRDTNPLSQK